MRILFVSHEASATGAPIVLLNFAKWLRTHVPSIEIQTFILKNGEHLEQWKSVGKVFLVEGMSDGELPGYLKKICADANGFDLVYFNTIETSHVLSHFVEHDWFGMNAHSMLHVHELEGVIQKYGADKVKKISDYADMIIAVSQGVRDNLVSHHGFKQDRIDIIYPCTRDLSQQFSPAYEKARLRDPLQPATVLSCGVISVVKGPDLFVQIGKSMAHLQKKNNDRPVAFQWVGSNSHGILAHFLKDIEKLGIQDTVSFAGYQENVAPWFANADVFFLSSREDPCPLVCLEAASLGLPIVYFKQSGGMEEVLGDWAGFPVPFMDVDAAAKTILHVLNHQEEGCERGKRAREIYQKRHMPQVVYAAIFNKITELLENKMEKAS